jgi:hypothetical protein
MRNVSVFTSIILLVIFVGCSTHIHTIGDGPQEHQKVVKRQWYALYGTIPLNEVDTNQMAGGTENYEISSKFGLLDGCIIGFFGGGLIGSRTVTVKK